jgi:hypothetical protein
VIERESNPESACDPGVEAIRLCVYGLQMMEKESDLFDCEIDV